MYLTSLGHTTVIDLHLGKVCYRIFAAGKGRGGMFLFLLFFHFHSFSFLPCTSLSSPQLCLVSLSSLSQGDDTK